MSKMFRIGPDGKMVEIDVASAVPHVPRPAKRAPSAPADMTDLLYTLSVELDYVRPLVWRTLTLPATLRLDTLHEVLQTVMGWTNSHLHLHHIDDKIFGPRSVVAEMPDGQDETQTRLGDVVTKLRTRFVYVYDLGSEWTLLLRLEKIEPMPADSPRVPRCIAGQRTPPPENAGDPHSFDLLLDALEDPTAPDHAMAVEQLGRFDMEAFDLEAINRKLAKLKPGPQARRRGGWSRK